MAGRLEASSPNAGRPLRSARRPVLVRSSPITAETLHSYLGRLSAQNLLRSFWMTDLMHAPDVTAALSEATGLSERHLISALPELRTSSSIQQLPYLVGQVSATAGTRPACSH